MTDRELMQQALDVLEWNLPVIEDYGGKEQLQRQHKAITALRDRLAKPETPNVTHHVIDCPRCGHCCPERQWVGLTDEEVERIKLDGRDLEFVSMTALHRFARDIQAKLKEKNT